jgi:hypothetical protein
MRNVLMRATALLLCSALSLPLHAGRRRAVAVPENALSITFVDAPSSNSKVTASGTDAWLDLDTVSQRATSRERSIKVRRQFGIRIDRAGAIAAGTAIVTARLESWDGRASVRIDGRPLTAAPFVVNRHAAVGAVTYHTLEIEVPETVPEGPLAAAIAWEVTTE